MKPGSDLLLVTVHTALGIHSAAIAILGVHAGTFWHNASRLSVGLQGWTGHFTVLVGHAVQGEDGTPEILGRGRVILRNGAGIHGDGALYVDAGMTNFVHALPVDAAARYFRLELK